jgi:fused signal recognition particle receptor
MGTFREKIKAFFGVSSGQEDLFDDLEDLLVEGDLGPALAVKTAAALRETCKKNRLKAPEDIRRALADLLSSLLLKKEFPDLGGGLAVILMLGVNGAGKTTTAAKLARFFAERGRRPILAAADTFRAAAAEQLKIHGERLGLRVVSHRQGGDPAAVVYDAIEAARAGRGDLIVADTAGRMHTKSALVEELKKIDRVVESKAAEAVYVKLLVLDATTGGNALAQAEVFDEAVKLDGVVLTKCDSSAKGGIAWALSESLSLPLLFVCDGEGYGNIHTFDPQKYTEEFM